MKHPPGPDRARTTPANQERASAPPSTLHDGWGRRRPFLIAAAKLYKVSRARSTRAGWTDRAGSCLLPILFGLAPAAGWACTPLDPERRQEDRPISVAADGSFVDAAVDDIWSPVTGRPVRNIGGGRVGQVIEASLDCAVYQVLLFADCTSGEAIFVRGLRHPDGGAWWTERVGPFDWPVMESTRALQAAHGPLALTPETTVADILAVAAQGAIQAFDDVAGFIAEIEAHNRFDPFQGCRIFYPGLRGAG